MISYEICLAHHLILNFVSMTGYLRMKFKQNYVAARIGIFINLKRYKVITKYFSILNLIIFNQRALSLISDK